MRVGQITRTVQLNHSEYKLMCELLKSVGDDDAHPYKGFALNMLKDIQQEPQQ